MEISRDIGAGKFTWTDVVTGVASTRTEYSQGTAATSVFSDVETAWKDGTIVFAQSSANTGTTKVAFIGFNTSTGELYASVNGTTTVLASA